MFGETGKTLVVHNMCGEKKNEKKLEKEGKKI